MNQKTFKISALIMTALMLVFGIIDNVVFKYGDIFSVINPLLFVATLVAGILGFKDSVSFESKWTWVPVAVFFSISLSEVAYIPYSIANFESVADKLIPLLFAAGFVIVFLSIFSKNCLKLMPIGFGIITLTVLLNGIVFDSFSVMTLIIAALYAVFAVISLDKLKGAEKFLRFAAVILAVICSFFIGYYEAAALIVLAFLLVPGGKLIGIRPRHIVAVLCVVVALAGLFLAVNEKPFASVDYISDRIDDVEDELDFAGGEYYEYKQIIVDNEDLLKKIEPKFEKAEADLEEAETKLRRICDRSYYSSWYCDSSECKKLHEAVEDCEDTFYEIRNKKYDYEEKISDAKNKIEFFEQLESRLSELRVDLAEAVVGGLIGIIAILLCAAGLICFAIYLFNDRYGKLSLIACGLLALGSLVYMFIYAPRAFWSFDIFNIPLHGLAFGTYFWSVFASIMFAVILSGKTTKLVRFRVLAIVASVAMIAFCRTPLAFSVVILYAITLICLSFVLVPSVFTEYNGIGKHIFFTVITLGIWRLIWIYNVTKNLNKVSSVPSRKAKTELILCLFLPFYNVYWLFKTAEAVEAYGKENAKQFKIDILCLAVALVCPIVSEVILQDKINQIVGKGE